jgi:hypothetical protein
VYQSLSRGSLVVGALVFIALPVFGQETQSATSAVDPGKSSESISTASPVSPTEKNKKALAVPAKNLIAEKATAAPRATKPAGLDNAVDAGQTAPTADNSAELTKKLSNPLASLISLPIQMNFDRNMGSGSGSKMTTNVQPVIPVALNKDWNMISRTIIPIIHQSDVSGPGRSESGLGDITQSLFFSPSKGGITWGAGPVILIPTATNKFLGSKQLGLGPTFVALKQQHGWTGGTLWNHVWKVAGGSGRANVNFDFIQPFVSYAKKGWTYGANTEASYDWTRNHWSVPIHLSIKKLVRFGTQPMQFEATLRCWATSPSGGPTGCGPRFVVTALFPKM